MKLGRFEPLLLCFVLLFLISWYTRLGLFLRVWKIKQNNDGRWKMPHPVGYFVSLFIFCGLGYMAVTDNNRSSIAYYYVGVALFLWFARPKRIA